jgi:hypothetical protein
LPPAAIGHDARVLEAASDQVGDGDSAEPEVSAERSLDYRFELFESVLLAIAAILTAWSGFQATKWSGVQADSYSQAGAARTESVRESTRAGQLAVVDVDSFTSWVAAVAAAERAGRESGLAEDGSYTPVEGTEAAFLYERFRPEFAAAVEAWLAAGGISDESAPRTPFVMPEYRIAESDRALELEQRAERLAADARQANQDADNYVLMTILFALSLVLIGIGSKMDTIRARLLLDGVAVVALVAATVIVFTFPIEF